MPIGTVEWIGTGMLLGPLTNMVDERTGRASGCSFRLRNQFFHGSHPLGWVRRLRVSIDDEELPASAVALRIRGQAFPSAQVPSIADVWWQPREIVVIEVDRPGGLAAGEHAVACGLELSTFFFTPAIDRQDRYPTMPLHLEARMRLLDGSDGAP
jgi:hypothetical protein